MTRGACSLDSFDKDKDELYALHHTSFVV